MTYRNDHEATLQRADDLQNDLEREQEKSAELAEQTVRLEAELAAERAARTRLEAKLGARTPEPSADRPRGLQERPHIPIWREDNEERRSDLVGVGIALVIFFGMVLFVLALAIGR